MAFWNRQKHEEADARVERRTGPLTRQEKIALRQFRREVEAGNRRFESDMRADGEHQSFLKLLGLK